MDKFENCMNPPEYTHSEKPVIDTFTKDGNTNKTADTEYAKNMVNHPVKSTEKDTDNTTDKLNDV